MKTNKNILISVIIPVYNVEKYLRECLESIINQTFSEIEIICINDGSTDNSSGILEEYKKIDERIIVLTQDNSGASVARNTGLRMARGRYICFVDSDDMLIPTALEKLFETSEKDKLDILFFCPQMLYEDEKMKLKNNLDEYFDKKNEYLGVKTGRQLFCEMQENNEFVLAGCLCFLKRDFMENNKIFFYEGIIFEDNIFLIQCCLLAMRTSFIVDKLYIYRIRKDSVMTRERSLNCLRSRLICIEETLRMFYTYGLDEKTKKCLSKNIVMSFQNAKKIRDQIEEILVEDENIATTYISDILYKGLRFNENSNKNNLELLGFEVLLEKAQNIILYGAGEIGERVYWFIKNLGYENKIKCFAITNDVAKEHVNDIPVYKFEKLKISENDFLILSASPKFQHEMLTNITKKNIKNYEIITSELAKMIRKKLDSSL